MRIKTREMSFIVDRVVIQSGGRLDGTGGGYSRGLGPGAGTGLQGGSYGSLGGRATSGKHYGSLYVPRHPGSGGGGSAGGSWINITAGRYTKIDGTLTVNGADGNGAGSGGSLTITTSELTGYGSIESSGGTDAIKIVSHILNHEEKITTHSLTKGFVVTSFRVPDCSLQRVNKK